MTALFHIEVVQQKCSRASKEHIKELVHCFLSKLTCLKPGVSLVGADLKDCGELKEHVESIAFCDVEHEAEVGPADVEIVYHVYKLDSGGPETDTLNDAATGEEFAAAELWPLPSRDLHGLWESLVYDSNVKRDAVLFMETAVELAERGVDPHLVACNRVILLHGPPGTGKTSLCRALAHKLAVRLGDRFPRARLLEINAHGLFSKWFAESGKLVARLFERIGEVVADRRLLALVLVDEVESLAAARRAALAGLEPSDAIRAVNALLTQLDRLRRHPNVLVLTTSNVTGAIDVAFVDRADLKRLVGPPSARAAYEILRGCCEELRARGAVGALERLFAVRVLEGARFAECEGSRASLALWEVAREASAAGASGRVLRRLPLLALARHPRPRRAPPLDVFLEALGAALREHLADLDRLAQDQ